MASSYMPWAARPPSSRNGEPASRRRRTRSRARRGPPSATAARRACSSSVSARQAARFACAASDLTSAAVWITGKAVQSPRGVQLTGRGLSRAGCGGNAGRRSTLGADDDALALEEGLEPVAAIRLGLDEGPVGRALPDVERVAAPRGRFLDPGIERAVEAGAGRDRADEVGEEAARGDVDRRIDDVDDALGRRVVRAG